ncbi:MAG: LysR family transcriptional regulator [Pseudomonadota bacterium]
MDTNAVRLFVLAADKLNISAAGRELGLAPSVASAWMSKLETTLGADLLHRSTRKVALSIEGAEFLPFARDIIAREDAARAALGQGRAKVSGTLRFTAPSSFAQQYISPILPAFLAQEPGLTLDCRLSDKQFDLIEGSFDLALRNAPLRDSSLRGRKLADDTRVLCAAPDYLEKHGVPQHPSDLRGHHLIAFASLGEQGLIHADGAAHAFAPGSAICQLIMDDGNSHKGATVAGAGISANSLWSVHAELASGALVRVLPDWRFAEETDLWLLYPQANVMSPKVRVFIDFLLERIGKHPPWTSPTAI